MVRQFDQLEAMVRNQLWDLGRQIQEQHSGSINTLEVHRRMINTHETGIAVLVDHERKLARALIKYGDRRLRKRVAEIYGDIGT